MEGLRGYPALRLAGFSVTSLGAGPALMHIKIKGRPSGLSDAPGASCRPEGSQVADFLHSQLDGLFSPPAPPRMFFVL